MIFFNSYFLLLLLLLIRPTWPHSPGKRLGYRAATAPRMPAAPQRARAQGGEGTWAQKEAGIDACAHTNTHTHTHTNTHKAQTECKGIRRKGEGRCRERNNKNKNKMRAHTHTHFTMHMAHHSSTNAGPLTHARPLAFFFLSFFLLSLFSPVSLLFLITHMIPNNAIILFNHSALSLSIFFSSLFLPPSSLTLMSCSLAKFHPHHPDCCCRSGIARRRLLLTTHHHSTSCLISRGKKKRNI